MAKQGYSTTPLDTDKMPPGIPYIVGNEAAERFNYYGMRAILVVFMTQHLMDRSGSLAPMTDTQAAFWFHVFNFANYALPVAGAILADAFWGKYKTIFWISLVYCLGSLVLAIDHTRLGLALGLTLIAVGSGGIKPCVSANVGDQFGKRNQHLMSRAFGWFYFSINAGSFVSIFLTPVLLRDFGPAAAFGVPALLMVVATIVFWAGRRKFVHVPPMGREYFKRTFNRDGVLLLLRLTSIFVFVAIFWSLWDQTGGEWVLQAEKMDRNINLFGWHWEVLSSQVQAVNAIFVLLFIPLFQYVVYPVINRVFTLTPLRKIGLGLLVAGTAFLVSAWIEVLISRGEVPHISWQMPAYALITAAEVMVSITCLEFAYTQAPRHMKAMVQALYLLSIASGNGITALFHLVTMNPDGTSKLHGSEFYLFFSALSIGCVAVYVFVAKRYKEVPLQVADTTPPAPPPTNAPQGT